MTLLMIKKKQHIFIYSNMCVKIPDKGHNSKLIPMIASGDGGSLGSVPFILSISVF